jgi:hypothetical protein
MARPGLAFTRLDRGIESELEEYVEERFRERFPHHVRGVKAERYTEDVNVGVYFAAAEEDFPTTALDLSMELMAELAEQGYAVNIYLEPWTP